MKIELELTYDQEDAIICESLLQHYKWAEKRWKENMLDDDKKLKKALKTVYEYYSGEEP